MSLYSRGMTRSVYHQSKLAEYKRAMEFFTQEIFDRTGRLMGGYGRTLVMGILNVTPDSFSDGGRFNATDDAVKRVLALVDQGADMIDIGAESTRPGHEHISADTEIARLIPVLEALNGVIKCPVSVDTTKAEVAEAAFDVGATIINDVWGFQKDRGLADLAASRDAGVVLMHNRESVDPDINIIDDMLRFLETSLSIALRAGVSLSRISLDPGIGFGKTLEQNLVAIAHLDRLKVLGCPLLVGASRKSMIGKIVPTTTDERLPGTIALHTVAMLRGADIIRVHDVKEAVQAARITDSFRGL